MVTGRGAAVTVDAVVVLVEPFVAECLGRGAAPVAPEKIVACVGKIDKVASDGVVVTPVVFDQTPAGAVQNDPCHGVMGEVAVLNSDMACFVFVKRTVHADIDRFSVIREIEVFQMDVAAVDADPHTLSVN